MIFTNGGSFGIFSPNRQQHALARSAVRRICFDRHPNGHYRAHLAGIHLAMVAQ
jgi:hypothetical protein